MTTVVSVVSPHHTEHFDCLCYSPNHTLRFTHSIDTNEVCVEVYLDQQNGFFKRILVAIKYIFGHKTQYGDWEHFIFQKWDIDRLRDLLSRV